MHEFNESNSLRLHPSGTQDVLIVGHGMCVGALRLRGSEVESVSQCCSAQHESLTQGFQVDSEINPHQFCSYQQCTTHSCANACPTARPVMSRQDVIPDQTNREYTLCMWSRQTDQKMLSTRMHTRQGATRHTEVPRTSPTPPQTRRDSMRMLHDYAPLTCAMQNSNVRHTRTCSAQIRFTKRKSMSSWAFGAW